MAQPYKILVVAPAWIGDMVMGQTLLKMLKHQHGDLCQIDILVNSWALDVAARMPEVNQVFVNPFNHGEFGLRKRISFGKSLCAQKYDQVFVLPNSWKSALIPAFANIKKRTGFVGEARYGLLNDFYKLDKKSLPLMIDRFCALANGGKKPENIDYPLFSIDLKNQTKALNRLKLSLDKPVICICPAAEYGPAKRWPANYFAKLSDDLQQQGYQVWIMGSNKDVEIGDDIVSLAKIHTTLANLCGKTSLVEAIDLLACAKVVVSNDSGLMHVACAVDVNVIALYGSSSPTFTPPLSHKSKIMQKYIECSPCFQRTCKFGHYKCLTDITPDQVLQQINQFR